MKRLVTILIFLAFYNFTYSQWIPYYLPHQGLASAIEFFNINRGVTTGHTFGVFNERLYFTTNSGVNWILSFYPAEIRALPALQFVDSLLVYSGGAENLYKVGKKSYSNYFLKLPDFIKCNLYSFGIDGSVEGYKGVFLKSTNGGSNWVKIGDFDTTIGYIMDIHFFNYNYGLAIIDSSSIGHSRVIKTTNGGINWMTYYVEPLIRLNRMEFINSNIGFICGDVSDSNMLISLYGVIYKTTNGGLNWNKKSFPYTASITDLCFFNANNGIAIGNTNIETYGFTLGTKIFKTTDGGENWDSVTFIIGVIPSIIKSIKSTGTAFAAGYYYDNFLGIGNITTFKTTNFGVNWIIHYLNYDIHIAGLSLVDSSNFFMSGGTINQQAMIFKSTNGGTIFVKNQNSNIPNSYWLYQNYPNPFNSTTRIKFDCKSYGFVKLEVCDIQGKIISTLIEKSLPSGSYEVLFDASNLSTGIYFYTLHTSNFSDSKVMVYIK
ncbi:MAG: T9SS type A sorting domain-containing protein [Ignavibacteria bacterium]|nr:T9SS type A sorting domain-containing protein [Ignavibacteria bacterium]